MSGLNRLRGLIGSRDQPPDPPAPVTLTPIGVVRSRLRDLHYRDTSGQRATLDLLEPYVPALKGLDGFSHAIVLTWLDQVPDAERSTLTEHPGGDPNLPAIGVLALRTHHRPNPIGLTVVRIERVEEGRVHVIGLDVVDGTPLLDIKPYLPPYDSVPAARLPPWAVGGDT
ncbi:MAG: tRNA (N6-threonylcarbamoyladenosine(37)-N6)-methyltransferase TrmO [Dehalococcoidia bacterium]